MKKLLITALSICMAAALLCAPVTALADGETLYPSVFRDEVVFSSLADFATDGESWAFADGNSVILLHGENRTNFEAGGDISALGYDGGHYYFTVGEKSYILPSDPSSSPAEDTHGHTSDRLSEEIRMDDGYLYYYTSDETPALKAVNTAGGDEVKTVFSQKSVAKKYGSALYAVCGNKFYTVENGEAREEHVYYSNYASLQNLYVGGAAESLKTFNPSPDLVQIEAGGALTEVDLNLLAPLDQSGTPQTAPDCFPVVNAGDTHTELGGTGLLLCETGNARLVALNGKTYITLKENAPTFTRLSASGAEEELTGTINAPERAYALPLISNATIAFGLSAGESVKIVSQKITASDNPVLLHDFYIIENADGQRGYVAAEFITAGGSFNEGAASTLPEPDPQNGNNIKTAVLVMVIVVLLLIAAGYLTWLGTSGRKKPKPEVEDKEKEGKNNNR